MTEFWVSSGHHLTQRTEGGGLAVTDELILAYLARPELVPPADALEDGIGKARHEFFAWLNFLPLWDQIRTEEPDLLD